MYPNLDLEASQMIEHTAKNFRKFIRAKAGLKTEWVSATEDMKNWYRNLAFDYLVANGELVEE